MSEYKIRVISELQYNRVTKSELYQSYIRVTKSFRKHQNSATTLCEACMSGAPAGWPADHPLLMAVFRLAMQGSESQDEGTTLQSCSTGGGWSNVLEGGRGSGSRKAESRGWG